jgi:predicted dehydrogenase
MIKALLIGCGNIGAGYDLDDNSRVWTHARAYSRFKEIELSVFDENASKAKQIADIYRTNFLEYLNEEELEQYDIVSITTPTTTHFDYLQKLLNRKVPVVICEKPVVSFSDDVETLAELYKAGNSKVLVNYMRRFQEGYKIARQKLKALNQQQALKSIVIKYKRGFLNNASHAIDILEFFFDQLFTLSSFKYTSAEFDAFEYDPTLMGSCYYMHCPVTFIGVANASYAIFEIELFFTSGKVVICNSGSDIYYYYGDNGNLRENLEERQTSLLDSYMLPVVQHAVNLLNQQEELDNFISALRLNKEILTIIEPLKLKFNASVSD